MNRVVVVAVSGAVLVAGLSGCSAAKQAVDSAASVASSVASQMSSPSPSGGGSGSHGIPVGKGPSGNYVFEAQPAPGSCTYRYTADKQPLPDVNCTPGATNPKVTQATIKSTICVSGYTSSIRPPTNITNREKQANAKSYGYTGPLSDAEYDHMISLQLGGDPNDPRNLWVEPPSPGHKPGTGVNNDKDPVENKLKSAICSGKVTLAAAQEAITTDWTTALAKLGLH